MKDLHHIKSINGNLLCCVTFKLGGGGTWADFASSAITILEEHGDSLGNLALKSDVDSCDTSVD